VEEIETKLNKELNQYVIRCRRKGESTEETEQAIKEGEGDAYEHGERCTRQK
jgi:hypothetical protein